MSALTASAPTFVGQAFGLEIRSDVAISGATGSSPRPLGPRGPRCVQIELAGPDAPIDPADFPERTFTLDEIDGRPLFTIDRHDEHGYRVWIDGLGTCRLSPDGREILCRPAEDPGLRWRLLLAQGLPIAAALHGLEVMHASAVAVGDAAVMFTGVSGAGKTSVALHLVGRGAEFLADDVAALEVRDGTLVLHPGVMVANVAPSESALLGFDPAEANSGAGELAKRQMVVPRRDSATALRGFYFLSRSADVRRTEIRRVPAPDPRDLLSATFVDHVPGPQRALLQLDVCSRIAQSVPVYSVCAPTDGTASEVAAAVAADAGWPA